LSMAIVAQLGWRPGEAEVRVRVDSASQVKVPIRINLSAQPDGLYYLTLTVNSIPVTIKLIKLN
jgi:hypothetical protein